MLHDHVVPDASAAPSTDERRRGDRVPFPVEVTVSWLHDPDTIVRYAVTDAGDGGLRLRASTPLPPGLTGTVLRVLPEGRAYDRPVMVRWCRPAPDDRGWAVGLEVIRAA